jgi:hypothetical protein
VTYSKQRKSTGQIIPGEKFGPFVGENTFSLIVIWKVNLSPAKSVVCRHSTKPAKRPVVKVTASLDSADSDKTVLISSSSDGGQVKFGIAENNATDATLTLTVPKTGTVSFYISGEKESTKTNDVILTAKTNDTSSIVVGSTNVTVLWVNITLNTAGNMSNQNDKMQQIYQRISTTKLGHNIVTRRNVTNNQLVYFVGYVYEIHGKVSPNDFEDKIVFQRDADAVVQQNNDISRLKKYESPTLGELPVSDQTDAGLQDQTPADIFDVDMPRIGVTIGGDALAKLFANFNEFATYDNIRCTDVESFNVSVYVKIANNKIDASSSTLATGHTELPSPNR